MVILLVGCSKDIENNSEDVGNELQFTTLSLFDLKNLKIKSVEITEVPSEGGLIKGYFDEDNIVVINAIFGGAMNQTEYSIYNYNNLKFVKVTEYTYSAPIGEENFYISSSETIDYLIYNDKVFIVNDDGLIEQKNSSIIELIDSFEHKLLAE